VKQYTYTVYRSSKVLFGLISFESAPMSTK